MADGIKKISENVIIDKRALVVTDPNELDNDAISIGAIKSDAANKGLKIKTAKNTYSLFDASYFIMPGTITTPLLADKCVTEMKLGDKSVIEPKLGDLAVSTRAINNSAVTEIKIGPKAVTELKLGDEAVVTRVLKNLSVTNPKLANKAVTGDKVADKTITDKHIANEAITSELLGPKCIKNRHIDDKAVDFRTLADSAVYGRVIKPAGVENIHLAKDAVNTINVLNGAITQLKIADNSIVHNHIQEGQIHNKHLADASVSTIKLQDLCVTTPKIEDKAVTKRKLADDVIQLIGDPVMYDQDNNVTMRKDLTVKGNVEVVGTLTANKVYNAVFMDIAEAYEPEKDEVFIPGDIVQLNKDGKLQRATSVDAQISGYPIVGVVSDEYAACYGATEEELKEGTKIAVGLIGKVHVNVAGPVKLGDKIGLYKEGYGASVRTSNIVKDYVIGKALETNEEYGLKKVLCLIYPN